MDKVLIMIMMSVMGAMGFIALFTALLGITVAEVGMLSLVGMTVGLAGVLFGVLMLSNMRKL